MRIIKLAFWAFLTLALLICAIALIGQNTELQTVSFFSYNTQPVPKWLVILGSVFIGAILASIFFLAELIVLETRNIRLRRAVSNLERAIQAQAPKEISNSTSSANGHSTGPQIQISPAATQQVISTKTPSISIRDEDEV